MKQNYLNAENLFSLPKQLFTAQNKKTQAYVNSGNYTAYDRLKKYLTQMTECCL